MPSSVIRNGVRIFQPDVIIDVENERIAIDNFAQKNLAVFGDFPQLEPNTSYSFLSQSGPQISEVLGSFPLYKNLEILWKNSIQESTGVSTSLTLVNARQDSKRAHIALDHVAGTLNQAGGGFNAGTRHIIASRLFGQQGNLLNVELTVNAGNIDGDDYYTFKLNGPATQVPRGGYEFELGYGKCFELAKRDPATGDFGVAAVGDDYDSAKVTILPGSGDNEGMVIFKVDATAAEDDFEIVLNNVPSMKDLDLEIQAASNGRLGLKSYRFVVKPHQLDAMGETLGVADGDIVKGHAHGYALEQLLDKDSGSLPVYLHYPATATEDFDGAGGADVDGVPGGAYWRFDALAASNLANGNNGTAASAANYVTCLAQHERKEYTTVSALSTSIDVHLAFQSYLDASANAGYEKNAWFGVDPDDSLTEAEVKYSAKIDDPRIAYAYQGINFIGYNDQARQKGPEWTAFLLMCMQGAVPPARALTRLKPNITGTTQPEITGLRENAVNEALGRGFTFIAQRNGLGLIVERSITSWHTDDLTHNCEVSGRESVDLCVREVRKALQSAIGDRVTSSTTAVVTSIVSRILDRLKSASAIKDYRRIRVEVSGDRADVAFDIAVTEPLNFITATATIARF